MQYQNQDIAPLLNQIVADGFTVDNLFINGQKFWQSNISPAFQPAGRVVASEWGRGSTPLEALERAYNEAIKTYGRVNRRCDDMLKGAIINEPAATSASNAAQSARSAARPYVDPLS